MTIFFLQINSSVKSLSASSCYDLVPFAQLRNSRKNAKSRRIANRTIVTDEFEEVQICGNFQIALHCTWFFQYYSYHYALPRSKKESMKERIYCSSFPPIMPNYSITRSYDVQSKNYQFAKSDVVVFRGKYCIYQIRGRIRPAFRSYFRTTEKDISVDLNWISMRWLTTIVEDDNHDNSDNDSHIDQHLNKLRRFKTNNSVIQQQQLSIATTTQRH